MSQITSLHRAFADDVLAFAAAGCTAVGIAVRKLDLVGVPAARRLLRDAGMIPSCLTSSGCFPLDDPAGVTAALARTERHLAAASELGCDCLFVLPGTSARRSWEESAAATRPLLEHLLPAAERWGVRLALEPVSALRVDLGFLHGFDEALDYADSFATPSLGVVLELNNAWVERRLYDNVRERTDRIAIVQVSDFRVGTMAASERVVIGDGDIPLRRLVTAIAAAGYAGWYDIELLGSAIEAEGYDAVVPRALAAFRELWT